MRAYALSIDLEDWHQLVHRRLTGVAVAPSRHVVAATQRLLDLLDDAAVRATFFVVGMVADAYPELVREVHARGHEIGSHSYLHRTIPTLTRAELIQDLRRSIRQLEDLTGAPVRGFRAPEFSVCRLDHWCFDAIVEAGFTYDSSVFPVHGARYGIPDAPTGPFKIETPSGALWELPLATWQIGQRRYPVAGGTYYRILPYCIVRRALGGNERSDPRVLYFHPYEFHTGWLVLSALSFRETIAPDHLKYVLLHNFRTTAIARSLSRLLREQRFVPLGELYASVATATSNPTPRRAHA